MKISFEIFENIIYIYIHLYLSKVRLTLLGLVTRRKEEKEGGREGRKEERKERRMDKRR